ncbi:MAG: hypothetical protein IKT84_02000 [Bacteroidales bacterium]|nr:hypothetical protein [Bacteroidales bacterium]
MACLKDHSKIQEIMDTLPIDQGGVGRHKCAACAYELGYTNGRNKVMVLNIDNVLQSLDDSQAGSQRHKSAHVAYILGYYNGLCETIEECNK